MSIVQFLETLGASPGELSAASYAKAVEALALSADAHAALLARDAGGVNRLLGGRVAMRSLIATPD
jgi:hypothetical protein